MGIIIKHNPTTLPRIKKEGKKIKRDEVLLFIGVFVFVICVCWGMILLLNYLTNN